MDETKYLLLLPVFFITDFHLIYPLETPTPFPNRYGKPQFSLVIFEAISVYPASTEGELDIIKEHHLTCLHCLKEYPRPRHKIRLVAGDHHGGTRRAQRAEHSGCKE
jgi:hypothetical protein